MLAEKSKFKFKNIRISDSSLSSIYLKKKQEQKIPLSQKFSTRKKTNLNSKNKYNIIENEEYGYELDESSEENNLKNDLENNNIIMSSYINKSNGENLGISENNNQIKNTENSKKEFISIPITKINLNKTNKNNKSNNNITINKNSNNNIIKNINKNELNNIISYNSLVNNGFIDNKTKNIEIENDWNNSKMNFDGISAVSKGNSYENNFNENSNIIDNNYFNSPKNSNNTLFKSENFDINNNNFKLLNIAKDNQNTKDVSLSQKFTKNISFNFNKVSNKNSKRSIKSNTSYNSIEKYDNNKNENNNINNNMIDKLEKEKKNLEEKLEKEKIINKEKNIYIEILKQAINNNILKNKSISTFDKATKELNKNSFDLIIEYTKYKFDNERIKKSIIMQKILIDDMKNELDYLRKDKKQLQEEMLKYKTNYNKMKEKLNEYEIKLKDIKKNEDNLKINLNKQKNVCFNMQKEINILKQKNEDLIEINEKVSKEKCIVNIEEKSLEDYKKILHEKNNEIKELKKENMDLLTNVDLKDRKLEELLENKDNNKIENNNINNFSTKYFTEQIEKLNNNLKIKDLEIYTMETNENNIKKIIDESYEIIKEIYKNIQTKSNEVSENELNQQKKIILQSLKEINEHINMDNNGNISLNDKLKTIKEFNNIMKTHIELLFNNIDIIKRIYDDNNKETINIQDNNKINNLNLFNSQNGQNNAINNNKNIIDNKNSVSRINNFNKKNINNEIFKKIDITLNNFGAHNSEKSHIYKYNNRIKLTNQNYGKNKNLKLNNTITLQKNNLEKNSIIFKSNLSPLNKDLFTNTTSNKGLNKIGDIVESILSDDKPNKKSSNKLSLKVKELTDLLNNNQNSNKNSKKNNIIIKNIKKPKINVSEENDKINNTINIFPSNPKIEDKNKINLFYSLTNKNTMRKNINDKQDNKDILYKNTIGGNSNTNINSSLSNLPIILNYSLNNHKKAISSSNTYLNRNIHINNLDSNDSTHRKNFDFNKKNEISNTLTLESNKLNVVPFSTNENSFAKIGNNSSSFFETIKSKNSNTNNKSKSNQKILMKQKILEKGNNNNTLDINGLANEFMKPTFLKNNISISLNNNNNSEKGKENIMFKKIKKLSTLNTK